MKKKRIEESITSIRSRLNISSVPIRNEKSFTIRSIEKTSVNPYNPDFTGYTMYFFIPDRNWDLFSIKVSWPAFEIGFITSLIS